MDVTHTARLAAMIVATAVALTLVAAAVLTAGQRGVLHPVNGTMVTGRSPASDVGAAVAPRTTPPPTFPVSGGVDVGRPRGTLAATTVEHS